MKHTRKLLIALLVVLTLLMSMVVVASAATVAVAGSFNSWSTSANTSYDSASGLYTAKFELGVGTHEFKIVENGAWLGNNGTINDTTEATSPGKGWEFTDAGNCKIKVSSAGTYIFQYNANTNFLIILQHKSHDLDTSLTEATCTANGFKSEVCKTLGCGYKNEEVLQAPGHNYVDGVCSACGEAEPTEHVHFFVESVTQAPTCTEPGIKSFDCACGEDSYTEEISVIAHSYKYGACSACGAENPDYTFYIEGYINNKDYTGTDYAFVNGELTIPAFTASSYIYVKDSEGNIFWTNAYSEKTSDTFTVTPAKQEKMLIPTGFDEIKFTIVNNKNGTVTLSYEGISSCDHVWVDATCQLPKHCSVCEETDGENLVNHYYVDGKCSWCDATITSWTTVYVDNAAGWENVYFYAWSNTESIGTYQLWPGKLMTLGEDGFFTAQIPASYENVIFSNGNGTQTADLKVPTGDAVIYNNSTNGWSAPACEHSYFYPCDAHCQLCGELTNENASHSIVHSEAVAGTDCQTYDGTVEYWYCSDCGYCWLDEALTQQTNRMSLSTVGAHSYFYPCDAHCQVCGELTNENASHSIVHSEAVAGTDCETYDGTVEYWYCSDCGYCWLDEALTQQTNRMSLSTVGAHNYSEGTCSVCGEADPDYVEPGDPDQGATVEKVQNFTENGKESDFFVITGNLSTSKGTVEYNGLTLTQCLKMESSTSITFTAPEAGKITLVFEQVGKTVKIDGVKYTTDDSFIVTLDLAAGEHTITKGDSINLFYMVFAYEAADTPDTPDTPHDHVFVDGKCECGEEDPNYVPPHDHVFVDGKCECGEEDPNYVPDTPVGPVDPIVNVSDLAAGTTTDAELIAGTGISATAGMTIESNNKKIDDFEFTQRLKLPGTMKYENGAVTNAIKIETDGAATIVVYAIAGNSTATDRTLHVTTLVDGALVTVANGDTGMVSGAAIAKYEITVAEAGTYYLGSTNSGINLYYIEVVYGSEPVDPPHEHVFVDGKCECGEEDPNYVPPHDHVFVDGKCECGEEDPNYVPPHEHVFVDGKCECGEEDPNYVPPHDHVFVDGKCECGEEDPNYVPPHEHNFVDGRCECGEEDPDYVAPDEPVDPVVPVDPDDPQDEEPVELNLFQKIIKAITDFFAKIGDFFKNLFAKK